MSHTDDQQGRAKTALVTGATGFIGQRLVRKLLDCRYQVRALVRSTSNTTWLEQQGCELIVGDVVHQPESVRCAVADCDVVFHLAAETHAVRSVDLIQRNLRGVKNVLQALVEGPRPARLIYVSSLAAVGPSTATVPLDESAPHRPVSCYGRSKAACEQEIFKFADQLSISIVRPPIVLGDGDRVGLAMFQPINDLGLHFVPGFWNRMYSVIHVDDLVNVLLAVQESGATVKSSGQPDGIYFAAGDEDCSFADLGRLVGRSLGRKRTWVIKVAKPVMWLACLINECRARLSGKPQYLNLDKFRDAFSGSWICSNQKVKRELGVSFRYSLLERLRQTSQWYRQQGWLRSIGSPQGMSAKVRGEASRESSRKESFG